MEPQENDSNPGNSVSPSGPDPSPPTPPSEPKKKSSLIMIIVIVVGVLLVVGGVVWLMNKNSDKNTGGKNNTSQSSSNANKYVSKEGGFSFTKPANWKQEDGPVAGNGSVSVVYMPPGSSQEDLTAILVAKYPMPEGKTLEQVATEAKDFAKDYPGFTVLETKKLDHNGNEAIYIEVKYNVEGKDIHQSQLAVEKGGSLYTVTATFPEAQWASYQEEVKTVSDSLKVE
jgi:hypothetical protein